MVAVSERCDRRGPGPFFAVLKGGGKRTMSQRMMMVSRSWKRKGNSLSPRDSREKK